MVQDGGDKSEGVCAAARDELAAILYRLVTAEDAEQPVPWSELTAYDQGAFKFMIDSLLDRRDLILLALKA